MSEGGDLVLRSAPRQAPTLAEALGQDWMDRDPFDAATGARLSIADLLDRETANKGQAIGAYYDLFVNESRSVADVLEIAQRMRSIGFTWQRLIHAYFVAARRASNPSLAAACATEAAWLLARDGHPRMSVRVVTFLLANVDRLPTEARDGFLAAWYDLRAWSHYAHAQGTAEEPMIFAEILEDYQRILALPEGPVDEHAKATPTMAALNVDLDRVRQAEMWCETAKKLLEGMPFHLRAHLDDAIRIHLALASGHPEGRLAPDTRIFLENYLAHHAAPQAQMLTETSPWASRVLLARSTLAHGRFKLALTQANRVSEPPWQHAQAESVGATALLCLGRYQEARVRASALLVQPMTHGEVVGLSPVRIQTFAVVCLCDISNTYDLKLKSGYLRTLRQVVLGFSASASFEPRRRTRILGMLSTFERSLRHGEPNSGVLVAWLCLEILELPEATYRKSALYRLGRLA